MRDMHWTQLTKDCYKRGCKCTDCDLIPARYIRICQVKRAVLELVRTKGRPEEGNNGENR